MFIDSECSIKDGELRSKDSKAVFSGSAKGDFIQSGTFCENDAGTVTQIGNSQYVAAADNGYPCTAGGARFIARLGRSQQNTAEMCADVSFPIFSISKSRLSIKC